MGNPYQPSLAALQNPRRHPCRPLGDVFLCLLGMQFAAGAVATLYAVVPLLSAAAPAYLTMLLLPLFLLALAANLTAPQVTLALVMSASPGIRQQVEMYATEWLAPLGQHFAMLPAMI